ncbi:peptidoglycan recognition family protein [Lysinibacter sp. HNR]|uniref:peptidoglycan recognition protein family protein n=1 Tax=Lysinibacter sp. HNR TaxID=3031408 RepID=UPI002434C683|nr:peptidoglycan recognition family protein [Lysinibacter sp. HNR]WGD38466.1 peptidoglycan recognition family protein [Lysinibacter sp. HNR]
MVFSHLATRVAASQKHSARTKPISRMIVHHTAGGTNEGNVARLSTHPHPSPSANYCLLTTGQLVGIVPEERRAWTSGSDAADSPSITIETVNTGGAPEWPVSDAQIETLALLAADLSTRYRWGPLDRTRIIGHREVAQTACPGPYLYPRLEQIVTRANEILHTTGPAPVIPELGDEDMIRIQAPGRGIALIGAGYYRHLSTSEEVWISERLISKHITGNDREFDVWVSLALGGQSAKGA